MSQQPTSTIANLAMNDGNRIPRIGFGTWPLSDADVTGAVKQAIACGYRLIDTAASYGNEAGVGRAVRSCGVRREELFVTTKLPGRDHGYDAALQAFDASAKRLGLDYVDLYLIHWPLPRKNLFVESWRAFVRLREEGRVRSIGVSNFEPGHIDRLVDETGIVPAIDQVELHPEFSQKHIREYATAKSIVVEAWSPLGHGGDVLHNDVVASFGRKYGKTPAQIVLRWHIELGTVAIPKSSKVARMRENIDVLDFSLTAPEVHAITALDRGHRIGSDPETYFEE
jgi:2,5-diketo-D-gluconate reductase A